MKHTRILISVFIVAIAVVLLPALPESSKNNKPGKLADSEEKEESGPDKQLAMWFHSKAYPNPNNLNDKYAAAWQQYLELKKKSAASYESRVEAATWASLGDVSDIGGRILCVTVDPGNSNTLWAGSASGGIWKSVNGGSSWFSVATGFPVLGVSSIIVDPLNSNVIYAGTGEVYRVDTSNIGFNVWKCRGTYGVGILKSTDGGASWVQVMSKTTDELFGIQMLKFDPAASTTIYACATDGLYRSTDAGANWNQILTKIYVSDVVINPLNSDQVVAAVGNMVNLDKGIYRTTNALNTSPSWVKISSGLPASFSGYIRLDNVGATRLYASVGAAAGGDELYLSTDFGANWFAKTGSAHCGGQYWFSHTLAINPSNTDDILIGGVNFYRYSSTNNTTGGSRSTISTGSSPIHSDHHDITYDPNNNSIIYVACDGGVYKSIDGGASWSSTNNGLRATQFYASFGVHPTDADIMIGGLQDNGVVSYDGGLGTWTTVFGGDGGPSVIASNGTTVLASNDARGVRRSTAGTGGTFTTILSQWAFTADDRTGFMAPVAISKTDPAYQYVATDNIHRTTNGTAGSPTWSNIPSSSTAYIEQQRKTAIALAVSPTNRNKIYVSTSNIAQNTTNDYIWVNGQPNIFMTTTPSTTPYTSIKNGLPDRFVMDFAISATNDDSVFIALGGFGTSHIYVTGNGGTTWTARGAGLPDVPFNAVVFDPLNPKIIYAGCDFGVYVSPDRGQTWVDFNTGFWDATLVMDLQISADNKLIAATHGKGVFKSDLYSGGTLPAKLIDFSGVNKGAYNQLKWIVTEEQNIAAYELERSPDGVNYSKVAVKQPYNSSTLVSYSVNDQHGLEQSEYYYRLKTVDNDGSFTYSAVVFIKVVSKTSISVVNNPFRDMIILRYSLSKDQLIAISAYNSAGALLRKQDYNATAGSGAYTFFGLENAPRGIYYLKAECEGFQKTFKLLKQ